MRLGCARDADGIWLTQHALPEAHGALGWTFPETDAAGRELLRWPARGDVLRDEVVVVELDAPLAGCTRFEHDVWKAAWSSGELLLAPWVPYVAGVQVDAIRPDAIRPDAVCAWPVVPHVHMLPVRTPTLPPATHTNTFLVGDADVAILVEPAPIDPDEQALLERWARAHGGVIAVFATHHHVDHVGGVELAERLGVPLWAHAETASRIRASVARCIDDGETVQVGAAVLEAIHTPGHAPGHLCLYERTTGTLIAGDMIAGVGTILVEPSEGDMRLYLASLERLRDLDARFALPAHGGVIATPRAAFQHYIDHRLARERSVIASLGPEGQTIPALLPKVYGDVPQSVWPLASLSLRAHLDKLVAEGRAHIDEDRFRAAERVNEA